MTRTNKILLIIVFILVVVNVFSLTRINQMKASVNDLGNLVTNAKGTSSLYKIQMAGIQNNTIDGLKLEASAINSSVKIYDENQRIIPSSQLSGGKLYFRFFEQNCIKCLTDYIKTLDNYCKNNHLSYELISNFSTKNSLKIFKTSAGVNAPVLTCDTLLQKENVDFPYFFVLTPDHKVQNVFLPLEGMEKYQLSYLEAVRSHFEKGGNQTVNQ